MVSPKVVVARFKTAFSWMGIGDDQHVAIDTPNGKWVVKVRLKKLPGKTVTRFYVAIKKPDGNQVKGPGDYRTKDEAVKEANIWIKDLKRNGKVTLIGWKPDDA